MSEPRKHHYVPKSYLRQFSTDGESIIQIEKIGRSGKPPREFKTSIRDAAEARDYHGIDAPGVQDPNVIEKQLSPIETRHAEAVRVPIESGISDLPVRQSLASLVLLMLVRVQYVKAFIANSMQATLRMADTIAARSGGTKPVPADFKEVLSARGDGTLANWAVIEQMFGLAGDPEVGRLVRSMHVSLWRSDEQETEFLTSDNPVSLFRPDAKRSDNYGTGIGHPKVQLTLPLSRRVVLMLGRDKGVPEENRVDKQGILEYNRRTIVSAERVLFAANSDAELVRQVRQHQHCSIGAKIEVIDAGNRLFKHASLWPVMPASEYPPASQ